MSPDGSRVAGMAWADLGTGGVQAITATDDTFAALPEAALVIDATGRVLRANARAVRLIGGLARGLRLDGAIRPTERDRAATAWLWALAKAGGRPGGCWIRQDDGREVAAEATAAIGEDTSQCIVVLRESHEQEQRHTRARDEAKMAAVATLAQGIVNDFSNALAAIGGALENARLQLPTAPAEAEAGLEEAHEAVQHAARLVRRLRPLATPTPSERRPIDPRTVVEEAVRVLERQLPPLVRVQAHFAHEGWRILADPEQVADLLVAIGQNAADAMHDGGTVVLRTARMAAAAEGGAEYVRIDVEDSGCGIPAAALPRIFDPFYTTKPTGGGAGLGLATAWDLMRQHEGGITVESTVGRGTTVHLVLPRTQQPVLALVAGGEVARGAGLVLLVDDDPRVRRPLRTALQHHGFEVLEAADGDEALELHAVKAGEIRAVVTDHRMPRVSGLEVLQELKRRQPSLPVVLVSGHSLADLEPGGAARPDAFLRKPFELKDLARTVHRLLEQAPAR